MTWKEWLLLGSMTAVGLGCLLGAWALYRYTAPAGRHHVGHVETVPSFDQLREDVEVIEVQKPTGEMPEPVEHVGTLDDPDATVVFLAGMKTEMQVKDDLTTGLDVDVATTLDRLQREDVPAFSAAVDAALAKFDAPPPAPHRVSNREFVEATELKAWATGLTGSFRKIPLSSDTQEIPRDVMARIIAAGAPK